MATLLRVYSYLYHFALSLVLFGMSGIALASGASTFTLAMLPWKGTERIRWVFYGSLIGLLSVILAVTGIFRYLFPLWALAVLVMMVRGFLIQGYVFSGKDEFYAVLALIAGALGAFLASLTVFKSKRR